MPGFSAWHSHWEVNEASVSAVAIVAVQAKVAQAYISYSKGVAVFVHHYRRAYVRGNHRESVGQKF